MSQGRPTLPSQQWPPSYSPSPPSMDQQYSTTVIQRPQPPRRRARSILWQHPLKRRGGQRDLHREAQQQGLCQQVEPARQQEYHSYTPDSMADRANRFQEAQPTRRQEYNHRDSNTPSIPEETDRQQEKPHEIQVPILDLNPLASLNEYRRSMGLGPSKNLMSSAIYDKDPSVLNAYKDQGSAAASIALTMEEQRIIAQAQARFK